MPEELERKLQQEAAAKFPDDPERQRRYVYGTLRKTGWTPQRAARHPEGVVKGLDQRAQPRHIVKAPNLPPPLSDERRRQLAENTKRLQQEARARSAQTRREKPKR